MVIGSLSAMVASAPAVATDTRSDRSDVTGPRVTVNVSSPSDSLSSTAPMVTVRSASAALFAVKVTSPDVEPRSPATASSPAPGADRATFTLASTACDSVTVKVASEPSLTAEVGPLTDSAASSSSW